MNVLPSSLAYLQIQNPGNVRVNQASNPDVNILNLPVGTNSINLDPNLSGIQNEALPEDDSEIVNEALSPPTDAVNLPSDVMDSKPLPGSQNDVTKFSNSNNNDVNNAMTSACYVHYLPQEVYTLVVFT